MFDFDKWCATGFIFNRDGVEFKKYEDEPGFYVDDCEYEVFADDQATG